MKAATLHSLPRGPASVEDRRMSLDTGCHEQATYSSALLGATGGRERKGSAVKEFMLCENHSQLLAQVDRELKEDGWSSVFATPMQRFA